MIEKIKSIPFSQHPENEENPEQRRKNREEKYRKMQEEKKQEDEKKRILKNGNDSDIGNNIDVMV